jgi:phosphoribosylanthranilate isomerase
VPAPVARVGVFVDEDPEAVARAVRSIGLDVVQLHGDEPAGRYEGVGARVVKAVRLAGPEDVARAAGLPAAVQVLVDAHDPVRRGGTGRHADWALAADLAASRSVWLAGGLRAETIADAIRAVAPTLVDVSSGVESSPGIKDARRLREFFAALHASQGEPS